jgi:hypothetical protein
MLEGVQSCSAMARGGRRYNAPKILVFPLFPSLSLSLSSFHLSFYFRHRE